MLRPELSRQRQKRLLDILQAERLDAAVIGLPHHVYYFSAHWTNWTHQSALVVHADGRAVLVSANQPNTSAAADEAVAFEANWLGTQRQEQPAVVAEKVVANLRSRGVRRIGIDSSAVTAQVAIAAVAQCVSIDPTIWQMRRVKDADELDLLKKAIQCTKAMYKRAREVIEPGVQELTVFAELHAAAVAEAGEPLTALLGNDYASGVPGGPPRGARVAHAGEIYLLDLGPTYRGYFADNCRAFSVDRKPTDAQLKAADAVTSALTLVEKMARPGVRCEDIFQAVDAHMKQAGYAGMPHHLGHGIGLQPHEFPHLNPKWDDVLLEGEVFTVEPGLYGPAINGGIRIENDYLVTRDGVVNLLNYPVGIQ